jgi:hypothetical protein
MKMLKLPYRRGPGIAGAALGVLAVALGLGAAASSAGTAASPPQNTSSPTIDGTPMPNHTLTAQPGSWSGSTPITYEYQWMRCNTDGGHCDKIKGQDHQSYDVRSADDGRALRVFVTATNSAGTGTATSDAVLVQSASKPKNTSKPTISGNLAPGQVLTANPGVWMGTSPISFSYQWQRCNSKGNHCSGIGGADHQTYTLTSADVNNELRVRVTAKNSFGHETAKSSPTAVVQPNAPLSTSRPTISGEARQGRTLTATTGGWKSSTAVSYYYQWARCDSSGHNCAPIPGATRSTYALTGADVGHRLIVQVKAQNSRGAGYADSAPTNVVAAGSPPPPPPPASGSIPVRSVSLPARLVIDRVQFNPKTIHSRRQPLVARFHVRETRGGRPVSGALVYAFGVPFNRLTKEAEVRTDGNGWATVVFRIKPTFPLRRGYFVVVLVRARKPGGSVLAGVSTRRFTSVHVG